LLFSPAAVDYDFGHFIIFKLVLTDDLDQELGGVLRKELKKNVKVF
jgi:hypothetical protein